MIKHKIFNPLPNVENQEKTNIIKFLYENLNELGYNKKNIEKAVEYALKDTSSTIGTYSFGGFIITAEEEDGNIVGAVVINRTGMSGYMAENLAVFIATHKNYRYQGIARGLMKKAVNLADGNVAIRIDKNNPAIQFCEKVGFQNKYAELVYQK